MISKQVLSFFLSFFLSFLSKDEFQDEFEEYHDVKEEEFDPFSSLDPDVRVKVYHLFGDILEVLR